MPKRPIYCIIARASFHKHIGSDLHLASRMRTRWDHLYTPPAGSPEHPAPSRPSPPECRVDKSTFIPSAVISHQCLCRRVARRQRHPALTAPYPDKYKDKINKINQSPSLEADASSWFAAVSKYEHCTERERIQQVGFCRDNRCNFTHPWRT